MTLKLLVALSGGTLLKTEFSTKLQAVGVNATAYAAKLPAGDIDYKFSGTIDTSEPKENFKFDRSSRLSPAPGLPGTWR